MVYAYLPVRPSVIHTHNTQTDRQTQTHTHTHTQTHKHTVEEGHVPQAPSSSSDTSPVT